MNLSTRIAVTAALILSALPLFSQQWMKWKREAEVQASQGFYAEAADLYFKAWQEKPEKLELAHQAGTYYFIIKEYGRAAESLQKVSHWNQPEKVVGLKYAKALKQSGRHKEAIDAFLSFQTAYEGANKDSLIDIVEREIEGCRQAITDEEDRTKYLVSYPGRQINSEATDFAPTLFGDDVLYFSSTRSGKARLYRSLKENGKWSKPETPKGLPENPEKHVANGSFSQDGQLFYYTICDQTDLRKQRTRCDLYVMSRRGSGWNAPQKLPDYINLRESTQTHPSSVILDGKEYLFFSSDRPGGQGNMDIWYVTRETGSTGLDYTLPENAGRSINTPDDDQMPFYASKSKRLFFSSNGRIGYGGFDIYFADGGPDQWEPVEHLARSVNSEADDMYFGLNLDGTAGFLVSNRLIPEQRASTREEDLFYVHTVPADLLVQGMVLDKKSQKPLVGARVNAYHMAQGEKVVFFSAVATDGSFAFAIPQGVEAWVQVEKPEYTPATLRIQDGKVNANAVSMEFRLDMEVMPDEIAAAPPPPAPSRTDDPAERPNREKEKARKEPTKEAGKGVSKEAPKALPPTPRETDRKDTPTPASPVVEPAPTPTEPVIASKSEPVEGTTRTINGRTPYQNKIRLAPERESDPTRSKTTAVAATTTPEQPKVMDMPASGTPKSDKPVGGTSGTPGATKALPIGNASPTLADAGAFTGEGLEKRYKGKRVDKRKFATEALDYEGIYYRIQLESVEDPDPDSPRYAQLLPEGTLETETLPGQGVTRMLVGVYRSLQEANQVLVQAKRSGFKHAFIVRYEDGVRLRRWK